MFRSMYVNHASGVFVLQIHIFIHSYIVHDSPTGVGCKDPSIPVWARKTHHSNVGRDGSPYETFFIRALDARILLNAGLSEHRRVCHWLYRYKQKCSSFIPLIIPFIHMFPSVLCSYSLMRLSCSYSM